jgi:hypothetical protein
MSAWPALPVRQWRDTLATLQLCGQIVGKVRLALTPKTNQWWNVPLYVTARGLTTSPMPYDGRSVTIDFDFEDHEVVIRDGDGRSRFVPLLARPVADFYRELFAVLSALGFEVTIWPHPVECPSTTPLHEDRVHAAYDPTYVRRFAQVLRLVEPVFDAFRARYRGKCSPVHLFWGTFDLAVSRHSGRRAPPRKASVIERDAYDEEVISLGFWPGDPWNASGADALFYSYTVPEPAGFAGQPVRPGAATYDKGLREFVLPYDDVRRAADPARAILDFAQTTYDAGARLGGWPTEALAYP